MRRFNNISEDIMNADIAARLAALRKENNYSQESLATALNISRQAISKWERAEASPDTDNLIALARLYRVSLDELVGIDTGPEKDIDALEEPTVLAEDISLEAVEETYNSNQEVSEDLPEPDGDREFPKDEKEEDPGFRIEDDEHIVHIHNGVLTVTHKPKKYRSFLSRIFGVFGKRNEK